MHDMNKFVSHKHRSGILTQRRALKMARSAHAFVRGTTGKFYRGKVQMTIKLQDAAIFRQQAFIDCTPQKLDQP